MNNLARSRRIAVVSLSLLAAGTAYFFSQSELAAQTQVAQALDCPAGYHATDPVAYAREFNPLINEAQIARIREQYGEQACAYNRLPESMAEIGQWGQFTDDAASAPSGLIPQGAMRAAVEHKSAMKSLQAKVANADGVWENYGKGPQISLQEYVDGARDGIPSVAGRVDDFAYDDANKRLFAAVGTGGIWMSEAVDGDVGTLADMWIDIGKNMPTTIASAVEWTPAEGGRLLVLTGEHVQGGNTYVGLGAFWSDNFGATWHQAEGVPDAAGAARLAVDQANPSIVYAATHKGLFRSVDAGASYVNVGLPVSDDCAGVVDYSGACQLANVVTDVVVKEPGGVFLVGLDAVECDPKGCAVLAAVGYRAGNAPYADGAVQAPGNGLYRSETGEPGTFARVDSPAPGLAGLSPYGFPPQERIGRIELGAAIGPEQDHNIVYAIVQDAVLLNGGIPVLDMPLDVESPQLPLECAQFPDGDPRFVCETLAGGFSPTVINGIYVSMDFGDTWIRLADDINLTYTSAASGSTLAAVVPLGIGPGIQAWYDLWIQPDPTLADPLLNAPTRLAFGMEEIWKNTLSGLPPAPVIDQAINSAADETGVNDALEQFTQLLLPMVGVVEQLPAFDYEVFGTYFAGETCLFLIGNIGPATPICPTYDGIVNGTTTHPDQHDGIFIADPERGGVWLIAGNDGGVYKQYSSNPITDDFDNTKWGDGANQGFYTLMNYGISVSGDGTVYYGLQDNASGKIEPQSRRQVRTYVGDGVWTAVDPNNSAVAYVQTPGLSINRTTNGGRSHSNIAPDAEIGTGHFLGPFMMDPQNADHLVAVGTKVAESLDASTGAGWVEVFDLGVDEASGAAHQARHRPLDVEGANVYTGWCGPCSILDGSAQFQRGLATNVGGDAAPRLGTSQGWHQASVNGLPNRFIYGVEMDSNNPETVFVTLGGYSTARWLQPGGYLDENADIGAGHVFRSDDAGENFVDISGNLPDTNVTAIVKRGEQLVVATDIGVFISSDLNGSEWAPLGDLENVPVNQLVIQPGDDTKLFAGTFGRGVKLYQFAQELPESARDTEERGGDLAPRGGALGGGLLFLAFFGLLGRRRRI
ncbi:MAG: hypothetical protein ACSHXK_02605 [Oceanococcus sp.]